MLFLSQVFSSFMQKTVFCWKSHEALWEVPSGMNELISDLFASTQIYLWQIYAFSYKLTG